MRVGARWGGDPRNPAGIAHPLGAARGLFARQTGEQIVHRSVDHELLGGVVSDEEGVELVGNLGRGGAGAAQERALELGAAERRGAMLAADVRQSLRELGQLAAEEREQRVLLDAVMALHRLVQLGERTERDDAIAAPAVLVREQRGLLDAAMLCQQALDETCRARASGHGRRAKQ